MRPPLRRISRSAFWGQGRPRGGLGREKLTDRESFGVPFLKIGQLPWFADLKQVRLAALGIPVAYLGCTPKRVNDV